MKGNNTHRHSVPRCLGWLNFQELGLSKTCGSWDENQNKCRNHGLVAVSKRVLCRLCWEVTVA